MRLLLLETHAFLRERGIAAGLALFLLAGLYAIEHGRRAIAAQRIVLASVSAMQGEHLQKTLAMHGAADGPGNLLYYLNFFTAHEPSRFAPVSLGLRDVQPFNLKIRMLALEGQLYDTDIQNPAALSLGNFDLAFLLVLLYPLLIVAFTHNVLSAEKESGTWTLVSAASASPFRVLARKAAVRFAAIPVVWLLTVAFAAVRLGLSPDGRLAALVFVSLVYLLFWFAVTLLVSSLGRSSNFNALALLGIWLVLSILVPATLNVGVQRMIPVPEAFDVAVRQREGYHSKWDVSKQLTMTRFHAEYPEYRGFHAPEERFTWGWYYAMQHMGDVEAATSSAALRDKLRARELWISQLSWLSPAAVVQCALNRIAATDSSNHAAYLASVREFHEQVRRFFYPFLFREGEVPPVNWASIPTHRFSDETQHADVWSASAGLLTISALLFAVAAARLRSAQKVV